MRIGSSVSLVVSNIYMEYFEKLAVDIADLKPTTCFIYVDDTSVVWPYGLTRLQENLHHLNNFRPTIQFTTEVETSNMLPFLDMLVMKRGSILSSKVYRKSAHTGCYLHFKSDHPQHVKEALFSV
jgi:hypothetical protein